ETCTTSDTSLPTWYRTTEFSSRAGDRDVEPRTAVMPARSASCRPFLCDQSPPVGMSSPGSPPSRAAADPLLEPGRADARVGVSWLEAEIIQRRAEVAGPAA